MKQHLATAVKPIEGRQLDSIERVNDSTVLLKFLDGEQCELSVEGDCRSHSTFYEIVFPPACKGAVILSIESRAPGETEDEAVAKCKALFDSEFYTEDQSVWDVVFKTTHGDVRVRHINVSNGYYDGYLIYGPITARPDWVPANSVN